MKLRDAASLKIGDVVEFQTTSGIPYVGKIVEIEDRNKRSMQVEVLSTDFGYPVWRGYWEIKRSTPP